MRGSRHIISVSCFVTGAISIDFRIISYLASAQSVYRNHTPSHGADCHYVVAQAESTGGLPLRSWQYFCIPLRQDYLAKLRKSGTGQSMH